MYNWLTLSYCTESVQFSTTKKCGGFLGVNFRDQWEYVCADASTFDSKEVCKALDCKNSQTLNERQLNEKDIQVKVNCPEKHRNINQCVHILQKEEKDKCRNRRFEITCEGKSSISVIYFFHLSLNNKKPDWFQNTKFHECCGFYCRLYGKSFSKQWSDSWYLTGHSGSAGSDLAEKSSAFILYVQLSPYRNTFFYFIEHISTLSKWSF